jgi:hypothetical protein
MLGARQIEEAAPSMEQEGMDPDAAVSPEEQADYEMVVKNATALIYGNGSPEEPVPAVLNVLAGKMPEVGTELFAEAEPPLANSPVDNLAAAAAMAALMLDASAQEKGKEVSNDVLFHAFGGEIVPMLAEDAEEAGLHAYTDEEIEGAFYRALDLFRVSSPRVDPDALGEEFAVIANADANGQLEQVLPGIGERMGQAG